MIKVKYIGDNELSSKGVNFIAGYEYDLKPEVAEYLLKTFGSSFVAIEVPKAKVVVEPKPTEKNK